MKVYSLGWHLALLTRHDHACHLPLHKRSTRPCQLIDKTKQFLEIFKGPPCTRGCQTDHTCEITDLFFSFHHLLCNCCSPSCGLLCVGSRGGLTRATAGGQKLYRKQTEVITAHTGSFTQVAFFWYITKNKRSGVMLVKYH